MATCPRCGGFLDERHRCARLWRLRLRGWLDVLLGGLVGLSVGWLLLFTLAARPSWLSLVMATGIGMIIVMAIQRG